MKQCESLLENMKLFLWACQYKTSSSLPGAHLIHSAQIFEEGLCSAEQSFAFWADDDISHISLGTKRIQKKLLPVGQSKRRQHHEIILVTDQKSGDGQRFGRLICTCSKNKTKRFIFLSTTTQIDL